MEQNIIKEIESYFSADTCIRLRRCRTCDKILRPGTRCLRVYQSSFCINCFTVAAVKCLGTGPFKPDTIKKVTAQLL
jgi:hypothetical protein